MPCHLWKPTNDAVVLVLDALGRCDDALVVEAWGAPEGALPERLALSASSSLWQLAASPSGMLTPRHRGIGGRAPRHPTDQSYDRRRLPQPLAACNISAGHGCAKWSTPSRHNDAGSRRHDCDNHPFGCPRGSLPPQRPSSRSDDGVWAAPHKLLLSKECRAPATGPALSALPGMRQLRDSLDMSKIQWQGSGEYAPVTDCPDRDSQQAPGWALRVTLSTSQASEIVFGVYRCVSTALSRSAAVVASQLSAGAIHCTGLDARHAVLARLGYWRWARPSFG